MVDTVELTDGAYAARLSPLGAAVRSVRHDGRELLLCREATVPTPPFAGVVLSPWPNRIGGGSYEFGDAVHQLPVNEVDKGNALHGLALWDRWDVEGVTAGSVTLRHTLYPRPGYPFEVETVARYELDGDGLHLRLQATNRGDAPAPVGLSIHPYLTVGDDSTLDGWTMSLPCSQVVTVDERLLPTGTASAGSLGLDFTTPRPIGASAIDHAFTGTAFLHGTAGAELVGADGHGTRISWDESCRWLQVYTMHAPGTDLHRRAVAIEPMTCAPDAFNTGAGLAVLGPGEELAMGCTIAAIDGRPSRSL